MEEKVSCEEDYAKGLACVNDGSATLAYDSLGRLVEIVKAWGLSQKIKYLDNGLIDEIESTGIPIGGVPLHWQWKYIYTYREQ